MDRVHGSTAYHVRHLHTWFVIHVAKLVIAAGSWIIDPLPPLQKRGLIAIAVLAFISLVSTFSLLCFFTYRFIFWKKYYKRYIGYNQYVVLMYNLALADFIQGLGFICWMTTQHPTLRLFTHYFWIFAAQFLNLLLYAIMFVQLRRKISQSKILGASYTESLKRLNRVVSYMVLYPIVYITLTLPLSAGRMASVSGHSPSVTYFCVAGALMTLSGFCDVLQYTMTRKSVVLDAETRSKDVSREKSKNGYGNIYSTTKDEHGPLTTVCAGQDGNSSTEAIVHEDVELTTVDQVYQHTTITVTHEPAY
nr:G protein-coupled receptor [Penicillium sclerotiorum]